MAASSTSTSTSSTSSPDVLASIITQVSASSPLPQRRTAPPRKRNKAAPRKVSKPVASAAGPPPPTATANAAAALSESVPLTSTSDTTPESSTDEHKVNEKEALDTAQSSTLKASSSHPPSPYKSTSPPKHKSSPWQAFLAALGCSSRSAQSQHFEEDAALGEKGEAQRPHRVEKLKRKLSNRRKEPIRPSTNAPPPPLPTSTQDTSSQTSLLPSNANKNPEAGPSHLHAADRADIHAQEVTANSSRAGVLLPHEETENVLSGAVVPPGADGHTPQGTPRKRRSKSSTRGAADATASSLGESESGHDDGSSDVEQSEEEDDDDYIDDQDEEDRIIAAGGMGIPLGPDGQPQPLLTDIIEADRGRMCLVLDLDETLVHSSFKMIHPADYVVPVEIENQAHNVYVIKRPGVDEFLRRMGEIYEVVVFTASLSKYADPVLDQLDVHRVVRHRLFRESCYNHKGNYVKDLSQLGRPIGQTIIIDNSPASYIFHPKNALPVSSWFNDPHDTELTDMIGVLADLATVEDVRSVLTPFFE